MAIVVNSKFRPFSMDEMLKVVMPAAQMQKETEDALGEIDAMSSVWEKLKDSEIDKDVYQQYQNFQNGLNQSIDDVYRNGVNINTRRALNKIRSRYAKEITPIEEAWNRRNTLAEEQRKAMLNDDSLLRQRVAGNIGLKEIMNNPSMDYGRMVSGDKLTARVATAASALAKEYQDNPEKLKELVGGDYYEYIKKRGFSSESILAALTEITKLKNTDTKNYNPEVEDILQKIVFGEINSSGIGVDWADDSWSRAIDYAGKGLWQAIGQDEAQLVQNWRKNAMVQNSLAMSRDAANSDRELNKLYLTQTAVPYMKKDGTVGYYEPITRTKNSKGGYDYSRNELPDDAVPGNPKGGNSKIPLTPEEKAENNLEQKGYEKLANVNSYDSMMETGYTPIFITTNKNGRWYSLNEGEDSPEEWGGWWTKSNVLTGGMLGGEATFKPRRKGADKGGIAHVPINTNAELDSSMTLVEIMQSMYPNIPKNAVSSMLNTMIEQGIMDINGNVKKAFEIFKVRSERGSAASDENWDYMVNIKN